MNRLGQSTSLYIPTKNVESIVKSLYPKFHKNAFGGTKVV